MSFINLVNVNNSENDLINEINRKKFFESLEFFDFDIRNIFKNSEDRYYFYRECFNDTLRKIKRTFQIKMLDSILYLEQDCVDIKCIIGLLDDWSKSMLKNEIQNKYGLRISKNSIEKFLRKE